MVTIEAISTRARLSWWRPVSIILGIYVVPVLMLFLGTIPFRWRFQLLIIMTIVAAVLGASRHYAASSLGLKSPRFSAVLGWSILPSMLLVAGLFVSDLPHRLSRTERLPFYLFFVFVSAPAQEFLYRSFLFVQLTALRMRPTGIVIVSAALFSLMHMIYRNYLTLALTFIVGLIWGTIFMRTKNFYAVALSHAVLGAVAVMSGAI